VTKVVLEDNGLRVGYLDQCCFDDFFFLFFFSPPPGERKPDLTATDTITGSSESAATRIRG